MSDRMEWISVKDRLPIEAKDVLVYESCVIYKMYYSDSKWWYNSEPHERGCITHWMPMPLPPIMKSKIDKAMELKSELFEIANSFGGDETGHIAVTLHQACNKILDAYELAQQVKLSNSSSLDHIADIGKKETK